MKNVVLALSILFLPAVASAQTYAPPAAVVEVQPVAPYVGAVWTPGYWRWHRRHYVWVGGVWAAPRRGYVWAPHYWAPYRGGWRFHRGYWHR
jgi:hypothetical protein